MATGRAMADVLREALALPPEQRRELRAALDASLEGDAGPEEPTPEWEAAWTAELGRRIRDADEGRSQALSYEDVQAGLRARFPFLPDP